MAGSSGPAQPSMNPRARCDGHPCGCGGFYTTSDDGHYLCLSVSVYDQNSKPRDPRKFHRIPVGPSTKTGGTCRRTQYAIESRPHENAPGSEKSGTRPSRRLPLCHATRRLASERQPNSGEGRVLMSPITGNIVLTLMLMGSRLGTIQWAPNQVDFVLQRRDLKQTYIGVSDGAPRKTHPPASHTARTPSATSWEIIEERLSGVQSRIRAQYPRKGEAARDWWSPRQVCRGPHNCHHLKGR